MKPKCSIEFADGFAYLIDAEGNGHDCVRADWQRPKRTLEKFERQFARWKHDYSFNIAQARAALRRYLGR